MPDREQQLIEAATRYQALLDKGQVVGVQAFAATVEPALREELVAYLEFMLAEGTPAEPIVLSPAEQALADRAGARANQRFAARVAATAPAAPSLTALRTARKLSLRAVARQVNLPVDLVARLERGTVAASTIPARLVTALALALARAESEIQAALATPPLATAGVKLSAEDGTEQRAEPTVGFAEALAASTATDAQKREWA